MTGEFDLPLANELLLFAHSCSCASIARNVLGSLAPPPKNIKASIIDRSITIEHSAKLSLSTIRELLEHEGFLFGDDRQSPSLLRLDRKLHLGQQKEPSKPYWPACQAAQLRESYLASEFDPPPPFSEWPEKDTSVVSVPVPFDGSRRLNHDPDDRYDSWMG